MMRATEGEPGRIENAPRIDAPRIDSEFAERLRVEADAAHAERVTELLGERDDRAHAVERVERVDEQRGLGVRGDEVAERRVVLAVGLHVAVRHRAGHGDAVARAGRHVRRRRHAGEVERAGGREPRVGAVGASPPEVGDRTPGRRADDARALRGDERLEVHLVDEVRLHHLRLRHRGLDDQQRLVAEGRRPLRHRPHIAREPQLAEPVEEARWEAHPAASAASASAPNSRRSRYASAAVEAARQQVVAPRGERACEQLERGGRSHVVLPVRLEHRELVEVGEQREVDARGRLAVVRRGHSM